MIALIIIGAILMYGSLLVAILNDGELKGLLTVPYGIGIILLLVGTANVMEKETEIRCLKGDFTYEQQFVYRLNDTIPSDTIYVKIK